MRRCPNSRCNFATNASASRVRTWSNPEAISPRISIPSGKLVIGSGDSSASSWTRRGGSHPNAQPLCHSERSRGISHLISEKIGDVSTNARHDRERICLAHSHENGEDCAVARGYNFWVYIM